MKTKTIFFSEHAYNVLAFCIIDCKKGCVFVYVYIKYFCAASKLQYTTSIPWAVKLSWLENASSYPLFSASAFDPKVGQTDPVLVCDQASLIGLSDYKSLCAAVMNTICATLVNIQTHADRQTAF